MEDNGNADDDPMVSEMLQDSKMKRPNRDLHVTANLTAFSTPALYDDDGRAELDLMLVQNPWFDKSALDECVDCWLVPM